MAYETSTATDLQDLLDKMLTFAAANGWTQDRFDTTNGELALSRNNVFVSMRWVVATPLTLSIHQALAFDGAGTDGGSHTDDSGNGLNSGVKNNGSLEGERCVRNIGDGPFTYHFFEDDVYLHCAVEISSGVWRHFGFGVLSKLGAWTGGEYAYGHLHNNGSLTSQVNICLLDGFGTTGLGGTPPLRYSPTIHVEGLPGMGGSSKWGNVWAARTVSALPNDTAGNAKVAVQGGYKAGPIARHFGSPPVGATTGLLTLYPIWLFYVDLATTPIRCYPLGFQPDVRGCNIANFAPGQEVAISAETWIVFPDSQKATTGTNASFNRGIAYKKVV